jgi:ferredoxin
MKATVNQETCIRCSKCASLCPAVFKLADKGKSTVIMEMIPAEQYKESVQQAQEQCPVNAITLEYFVCWKPNL